MKSVKKHNCSRLYNLGRCLSPAATDTTAPRRDQPTKTDRRHFRVSLTLTLTHSSEYWGHDPTQKEPDVSARLAQRERETLGTLFKTVYRVTRVKKDHEAFAVTNSIEFKEVITSTHLCSRKKENFNKASESTDSLTRGMKSQGKVRQTLSSRWFELGPQHQQGIAQRDFRKEPN